MRSPDSKTRARAELVDLIESQLMGIRGQARPHLSALR